MNTVSKLQYILPTTQREQSPMFSQWHCTLKMRLSLYDSNDHIWTCMEFMYMRILLLSQQLSWLCLDLMMVMIVMYDGGDNNDDDDDDACWQLWFLEHWSISGKRCSLNKTLCQELYWGKFSCLIQKVKEDETWMGCSFIKRAFPSSEFTLTVCSILCAGVLWCNASP